jgi:prophage regulatory protein
MNVMTLDRYIRIKELAKMLGISRQTIYRLIALEKFPKQIKLTERTAVWRLSTIEQWVSNRETAN